MPLVHTTQALSLSTSSPTYSGKKTVIDNKNNHHNNLWLAGLVIPIALENDCSEQGITIDSDDVVLTNFIRKHFLEHFGHRDLAGITSDYAPDAILIQVVNGQERTKYQGRATIGQYFRDVMFALHPVGESSFQLESITVQHKHALVVWSAKTPTCVITQASDTLVFNGQGQIIKQFFTCHTHERENPGTARVVRQDQTNEYDKFFAENKE